MKIAVIAPSKVPATTANSIQVMKASHALAQCGHDVRLWVPGKPAADRQQLAAQYGLRYPFEISWLKSSPNLRRYDFMWNSFRKARRWGADLVYTWLVPTAWLAGNASIPSILELHGPLSGIMAPGFFRRYLRSSAPKQVLVITNALRKMLVDAFAGFDLGNVIQISPNGFDMEAYHELPTPVEARNRLNLPQGVTAAYTGHFYPGRGMDVLLELAKQHPRVNFLWVGGTSESVAAWRKRMDQDGIVNVTMTGFIPMVTLPLYQAAADVLLMPYEKVITGSSGGDSAAYCSPMKMFDYLATGRAIISSDLPVLREVLNEGNAVFCPPEDATAWVGALGALLGDARKMATLANQAQKDAAGFTWLTRAQKALAGIHPV